MGRSTVLTGILKLVTRVDLRYEIINDAHRIPWKHPIHPIIPWHLEKKLNAKPSHGSDTEHVQPRILLGMHFLDECDIATTRVIGRVRLTLSKLAENLIGNLVKGVPSLLTVTEYRGSQSDSPTRERNSD
jgi:hypothetical protein